MLGSRRLLVLLVAVAATSTVGSIEPATSEAAACAGPPCGYINPQLFLDLDGHLPCAAASPLNPDADGRDCMSPPTANQPLVLEGAFRLTWDVSEEGTYLNDPNDPIEVRFIAPGRNPSFIAFDVQPSTFSLDSTTLYNPANYITKERSDGSSAIWFEYTEPVAVTFTRTGDPNADDREAIEDRDGTIKLNIRIHSDGSGATFRDSYGLETFNFHVLAADPSDQALTGIDVPGVSQGMPAPGLLLVAPALLGVAGWFRRRQGS